MNDALAGFFSPGSPKDDSRIHTQLDGSVEAVLLDGLPGNFHTGLYTCKLVQAFGTTQRVLADLSDCLLVLDGMPGQKRLVFRMDATRLTILPGSYEIWLLHLKREVLRLSLTVPATPPE